MSEQFLYFLQQMFNGVTLWLPTRRHIGYTMGVRHYRHDQLRSWRAAIGSYVSFGDHRRANDDGEWTPVGSCAADVGRARLLLPAPASVLSESLSSARAQLRFSESPR